MSPADRELITEVRLALAKMETTLGMVHEEVKRTNGRVTKLEKQTAMIIGGLILASAIGGILGKVWR